VGERERDGTGTQFLDNLRQNNLQLAGRSTCASAGGCRSTSAARRRACATRSTCRRRPHQRRDPRAPRALATGYRYFANVGLSYTFGSIYNTVVNPRFQSFGSQGGGFFFSFLTARHAAAPPTGTPSAPSRPPPARGDRPARPRGRDALLGRLQGVDASVRRDVGDLRLPLADARDRGRRLGGGATPERSARRRRWTTVAVLGVLTTLTILGWRLVG
jgi:hypothetical protein